MDLVSAARRLRRPFVFADADAARNLPIAGRGMIGDGFTAALVAADGAIDWLCMPRFDSPSVFARVLDFDKGGSMAIRPANTGYESVQAYDPDTNVLETLFVAGDRGSVRLLDFMPWSNDPRASTQEIHRRIDCPSGEVEVEVVFDPRFDYARELPRLTVAPNGVMAEGAHGERLSLSVSDHFDQPLKWEHLPNGGARTTFTIKPGRVVWCVIAWASESVEPYQAHRPFEQLRVTRRHWREWSSRLTYDGPWRHHVLRSALTLKLLMYAPTGAVVAAPTTSLPEWPGGPRNWDYRFTWTRDAAMAIRSANLIGYGDEARDFYHFLRDAVDRKAGLQIMYTIDGHAVPDEMELPHLAGSLGSRPVRIGNGARDQVQLDTTGAIIDAAQLFERFGGALPLPAWRTFVSIMEVAERTWMEPDHGMWEPRHGKRHNVHSKLMNWLAMDRGVQVARAFGRQDLAERWTNVAKTIHADICKNATDPTGTRFTSIYGFDRPDASLLQLVLHGFVGEDDPRLGATTDWVRKELGVGPYLYRYRDEDGVGGPESAFVLSGFWLSEAYALQNRLDEAAEIFVAHAESSNHLGLLSEEIAPDGTLLGNMPQAFSHLGLINAALRIDLALRLRDEGSTHAPHLVGPLRRKAEHHAR